MNNPIRAALQRHIEVPLLLRMGGPLRGARALEIGCGRGVGVELILDTFGAAVVDAFALDPGMVDLAQQRLSSRGLRVRLWVGDVTAIAAPETADEAVFERLRRLRLDLVSRSLPEARSHRLARL
ncbi:MAG TPA: class I SAM-dependent methyltransferase [Candidatus Paceibacterota bacterium]|nr:class I SAM-dependent methyltransferase [Candidatus Paceibacterota bacterium]HRZ57436.1 class I SAM-dependent methyltransferase [Candidatus Paceibacterota bacterium]